MHLMTHVSAESNTAVADAAAAAAAAARRRIVQ